MRYISWAIFGIAALTLVSWVSINLGKRLSSKNVTPTPQAVPTIESKTSVLETYTHSNPPYSFTYPSDMTLQTQADSSVTLLRWGPTQKKDTEFYDGISLSFSTGQLEGKTLKEFTDNNAAELGGVFETGPVSEVTVGNLPGYKFHVKGYVEGDYYILDLGTNSYLQVIDATRDPGNVGFSSTVSQVLGSLTQ